MSAWLRILGCGALAFIAGSVSLYLTGPSWWSQLLALSVALPCMIPAFRAAR